jgi:hypothetical protein
MNTNEKHKIDAEIINQQVADANRIEELMGQFIELARKYSISESDEHIVNQVLDRVNKKIVRSIKQSLSS